MMTVIVFSSCPSIQFPHFILHGESASVQKVFPANPHRKLGPSQIENLTKHPVPNPGPGRDESEVQSIPDHLQPEGVTSQLLDLERCTARVRPVEKA